MTRSRARYKSLTLLGIGVILGVAIWTCSPWVTGTIEPWDANTSIWPLSWLLLAVIGGLLGHPRGMYLPLGYALGQILITTRLVLTGEFGALGWAFIAGYAMAAVIVTLAVLGLMALLRRILRAETGPAGS